MAPVHVRKSQLRGGWSGSLRDIGCPEARLAVAMLIPRTMLNMVILFLLLFLRLQLVSEHPRSPSVIYSPHYLQTFFELLIFPQKLSSELWASAPYLKGLSLNWIVRNSRHISEERASKYTQALQLHPKKYFFQKLHWILHCLCTIRTTPTFIGRHFLGY